MFRFSNINKHLTPSTAIALLALVFALTGGAFAATGGGGSHATLSASAAKKKAKPKSLRGPAGPAGKNGTNGTNGTPGATGPAGPKGENGAAGSPGGQGEKGATGNNGENGKSLKSTVFKGEKEPLGEPCKKAGGTSIEVEGSGVKQTVCNGIDGQKGLQGEEGNIKETLPPKALETGTWYASSAQAGTVKVPISLTIPLAHILETPESQEKACREKTAPCAVTFVEPEEEIPGCGTGHSEGGGSGPWSVQPGSLCVYRWRMTGEAKVTGFESATREANGVVTPTGVMMTVEFPEASGGEASGIWAVRAPTS
jgi:hypothetical protein